MNKKNKVQQVIDQQKEWQDNQFIPGYWAGSKIPLFLLRKNKKLGISLLVSGFLLLIITIISLYFDDWVLTIYALVLTLLSLFAGYKKLKN